MTQENTLPTFQDGEKYLECILIFGEHDFSSTDTPKKISNNVYQIPVICINCGFTDNKYNIILEEENEFF